MIYIHTPVFCLYNLLNTQFFILYLKPHELLSHVGNIILFYWWKILRFRESKWFSKAHTVTSTSVASRNKLKLYLGSFACTICSLKNFLMEKY